MTRTICTSQCTAFHKLGFYLQGDVEWNLVAFIILQHPVCPHQTSNILIKHLIMYVIYSDNRWGEKNLFKAARSKHVCLCSSLDYLKQVMHLSGSALKKKKNEVIDYQLSAAPYQRSLWRFVRVQSPDIFAAFALTVTCLEACRLHAYQCKHCSPGQLCPESVGGMFELWLRLAMIPTTGGKKG